MEKKCRKSPEHVSSKKIGEKHEKLLIFFKPFFTPPPLHKIPFVVGRV